ncbi:TetR/AcrR family transcriptional regulator [Thiomicrorhabdus sp. 6S2-11]|jgi:TetR/AcrR family transcriptional repressor of cmeABC operon|uniref:TetR/AcrR family transcriptional regulator n=1 Tax=Thiomicrorhabdus marina TaxID=2818442 RepID=A0ABS3Q725_9GAMM|nr:TetR/AcrR family transcriptional regulator [Thiomicrorhabdus marina]MBO1928160.1 TetR/AcrR family transcriptional regulator [Thiomicrorhabdus marina]
MSKVVESKDSPSEALSTRREVTTNKRGLARQQKLLEVAQKHFFAHGYAGANVNDIVREAGGSLNTLYRHFGNKLGLFEAVMQDKANQLFLPFAETDYWQADMENNLLNFGRAVQSVALSPDGLTIHRLVSSENNLEQSEIQRLFYKIGPQTAITILGDYLHGLKEQGRIRINDCYIAAAQFLEMIKGPFFYPALFGKLPEEQEMEKALKQSVEIFLNGCLRY